MEVKPTKPLTPAQKKKAEKEAKEKAKKEEKEAKERAKKEEKEKADKEAMELLQNEQEQYGDTAGDLVRLVAATRRTEKSRTILIHKEPVLNAKQLKKRRSGSKKLRKLKKRLIGSSGNNSKRN